MLGESGQLDCRAARVSPTLGLSGLPHRMSSRDLCRALPSQRELAHIEVLPEKCAIVQFSCMQAALGCLMGLGNSLNQLGWRYSAFGLAHHSFAVSAAPAQRAAPLPPCYALFCCGLCCSALHVRCCCCPVSMHLVDVYVCMDSV